MRALRATTPLRFLFFTLLCGSRLLAESPPGLPLETVPLPALAAYASRQGIAVQGVEFGPPNTPARAGDEVVYLLALQQPAGLQQWLVRLRADALDARQGETKPIPEDTIYTSTGLELHYPNSPAALNIEFIGPFETNTPAGAPVATRRGRTLVSAESLESGLFGYCESSVAISARLKAAGIANPVYYGLGRPPKPDVIAAGRQAAAAFQLTAGEERLAFSVYFALRAFYYAASEIPACREVLEQVLQKPSLWSMASNLGLNTNFEYGWHEVIRVPDGAMPVPTPVYALPVKLALNHRPALKVSLAVTTTQPPLRNCAGIVSLVAEHPTDTTKRVFLHLLSARAAQSDGKN